MILKEKSNSFWGKLFGSEYKDKIFCAKNLKYKVKKTGNCFTPLFLNSKYYKYSFSDQWLPLEIIPCVFFSPIAMDEIKFDSLNLLHEFCKAKNGEIFDAFNGNHLISTKDINIKDGVVLKFH